MATILADPIVQQGIEALRQNNIPTDESTPGSRNVDHDALASVRILNRMIGYNNAIADLLSLGEHVREPEPEPEATFGVKREEILKPIPTP